MTEAPTTERVAIAGGWNGTRQIAALTIDDVTRDLGDKELLAMSRDAIVGANLNLYQIAVVADDPQVLPAVTDKDTDGYDLAAEIATWVSSQIEDMDSPIFDSLGAIIREGLIYGCKISEVVLRQDTAYTGRTQTVLHAIKPKPRDAAWLGIDPFYNVQSVFASVWDAESRTTKQEELPKDGFLIYSFRPVNADPRGTNLLRNAYVPWDLKMKTWPEYYKYLVQFASKSLYATLPQNPQDRADDNGNPVDATVALLQELLLFQNGSALVLPFGSQLDAIGSDGEGRAFLTAFELYNREITTAMLTATRATMEAEHGSRADSGTASDIVETFIRQTRLGLERAVRRSALQRVVRLNYGDKAVRLTPYLSLGGVTQEDVYKLMNAVALLERAGYLSPSQLPELDARLGLATRTAEEVEAKSQKPAKLEQPTPNDEQDATDDNTSNEQAES